MRTGINIYIALVMLVAGAVVPLNTSADGGRHGKWRGNHHHHGHHYGHYYGHYYGHHYDDSVLIGLGLGLVLSPLIFSYSYYEPAPIYTPAPLPPSEYMPERHSYNTNREKPSYCREYTKKIMVDGKETEAHGTACLQNDGTWRIMN